MIKLIPDSGINSVIFGTAILLKEVRIIYPLQFNDFADYRLIAEGKSHETDAWFEPELCSI